MLRKRIGCVYTVLNFKQFQLKMLCFLNIRGKMPKGYSQEDLEKAIEAVNNNELDQAAASVAFNVPGSTLHDKLIAKPNKNGSRQKRVDTFTEEKLAVYLKAMAKWRCLMEEVTFRQMVADQLPLNGIVEQRFKDNLPGKKWLTGFMNRNAIGYKFGFSQRVQQYDLEASMTLFLNCFDA